MARPKFQVVLLDPDDLGGSFEDPKLNALHREGWTISGMFQAADGRDDRVRLAVVLAPPRETSVETQGLPRGLAVAYVASKVLGAVLGLGTAGIFAATVAAFIYWSI